MNAAQGINLDDPRFRSTIVSPDGEVIRFGWEFYYTFGIVTQLNQSEFKLETNSPIQHEMVTGLKIRRAGANRRTSNGNNIVNDGVFNSSFITLKQRNAEVAERISLEMIEQATLQGRWFDVKIPLVDMAQSVIKCSNIGAIVAGEEYELLIRYWNVVIQKKVV
jgi:hypothetical protein